MCVGVRCKWRLISLDRRNERVGPKSESLVLKKITCKKRTWNTKHILKYVAFQCPVFLL